MIHEFISDPAVEVYACGPGVGKFKREAAEEKGEEPARAPLETTLAALESLGVPDERIRESQAGRRFPWGDIP